MKKKIEYNNLFLNFKNLISVSGCSYFCLPKFLIMPMVIKLVF